MTEVAVIPAAGLPVTARCERALAATAAQIEAGAKVDRYTRLLPVADLRAVTVEIERALRPASASEVSKAVTALVGAYPSDRAFRDDAHRVAYLMALNEDLAGFPADILREAVRRTRRERKFIPSSADVYQHAAALLAERRALLRAAEAQLAEHERRAVEAAKPAQGYGAMTDEQRARHEERMADLRATLAADAKRMSAPLKRGRAA